jgi:hypothetical protein
VHLSLVVSQLLSSTDLLRVKQRQGYIIGNNTSCSHKAISDLRFFKLAPPFNYEHYRPPR